MRSDLSVLCPALGLVLSVAGFALLACQAEEPPGSRPLAAESEFDDAFSETDLDVENTASEAVPLHLGQLDDNLPFEPSGDKLASTAWRTWVYTDTGPKRTRYGYLRAGAVVDRRGPVIHNDGCEAGWYRVNPRGFVCIGKGATLDLSHPVVVTSQVRAKRGQGLPYRYALSRENAPHLYFKLPSAAEMRAAEGGFTSRAAEWLARERAGGRADWIEAAPPSFLAPGKTLEKPYGTQQGLHVGAHAGKANADSGFALAAGFLWEDRAMALTTELDIIPLDRTKLVEEARFAGIALGPGEDLPVALVTAAWVSLYERDENGRFHSKGAAPKRSLFKLTGESFSDGAGRFYETREGTWVGSIGVERIEPRSSFPSVATGTRKWIDIALKQQLLIAYTGKKADYITLVSSGSGGLGDPEKVPATIQGTFMIHSKHTTATMDGEEDVSDSFELHDVPFVQYFHKGFALHAAYWHDDFGRYRSHGCINLSPKDAAWLFEWTDPVVPESWHAVLNKERGTVVHIHP